MKAPDFVYAKARSLEEAFRLKAEHGEGAKWLAGGQSLLAALAFRLSEPRALIDISRLPELQGIAERGGMVRIGAGVTHAALGRSELVRRHAPLLAEAVPHIAHAAIRNRGTIGGSLSFADPAAELPACVVALDALLIVAGRKGERRVAAREFFQGVYATALAEDEILTAIEVPVAAKGRLFRLEEVVRRSGDYAMAGVAVALHMDGSGVVEDVRPVFFALGDRPVVAEQARTVLLGRPLDELTIGRAALAAVGDIDPAGDLNGGPATKTHLAQVVLARALRFVVTAREGVAA